MRTPLKKFTAFTNQLLPSETAYLLSIQQFVDEDRLKILKLIDFNTRNINQFTPYDTSIDKRKYNHLQNWISERLKLVDVDEQFHEMLEWEQKIMNDSILANDEKKLLSFIKNYQHPTFFFTKFYELIGNYRHFLLIRLRYSDQKIVDKFLEQYKTQYKETKKIKDKIYHVSKDIVNQYSGDKVRTNRWKSWLSEVFYDENIEGHIRYLALVRLVFICHNYKNYQALRLAFDHLEEKFSKGKNYSKRLLLNYYSNRLLLHSHNREYDKALYYGYLSVKSPTHDYLLYVNNLCSVLLRLNYNQEALQLMREASQEVKETKNFHNKVGFIAFYMKALIKNGYLKNAEQYGDTFLKVYHKEVLQYRWHLFFSVYIETLFLQNQLEKLLKLARKFRLKEKDKTHRLKASYIPSIPYFIEAAQYREGNIKKEKFIQNLQPYFSDDTLLNNHSFKDLQLIIQKFTPELKEALTK